MIKKRGFQENEKRHKKFQAILLIKSLLLAWWPSNADSILVFERRKHSTISIFKKTYLIYKVIQSFLLVLNLPNEATNFPLLLNFIIRALQ